MAQVFFISKENVRDAWLSAVGQVFFKGDLIKTEYDKETDLPSRDATVLIEIKDPMSSPIMRREKIVKIKTNYGNTFEVFGCMADTYLIGSIQSGYIEEIMEGLNDHYIWDSGLSFPYSYHDRIYNYTPFSVHAAFPFLCNTADTAPTPARCAASQTGWLRLPLRVGLGRCRRCRTVGRGCWCGC